MFNPVEIIAMSNTQPFGLTIYELSERLYINALTREQANDDQGALFYFTKALNQIQRIDNTTKVIDQLQYDILLHICDINIRHHNATLAKKFVDRALQMTYNLQGEDEISECLSKLSQIKRLQGGCNDTSREHNKSIDTELNIDKDDALNVANAYINLARICSSRGKYDNAISVYRKALQLQLTALGDNHPSIADTYYNIGTIYTYQGRFDSAISMYEQSFKIDFLVLGEDHPNIAHTYYSIQLAYYRLIIQYQGNNGDDVSMLGQFQFGDDHFSRASKHNMKLTANHHAKKDKVLSTYEELLKVQLSELDNYDPRIANTYRNIGMVYVDQGNYDEALTMFNKSLEIQLSELEYSDFSIATTYRYIGDVYNNQGKYDSAISMYEQLLQIQLLQLGVNHPSIADTYRAIGSMHAHLSRYDDAISFLERAINILANVYPQNHPNIDKIYDDITICYDKRNIPRSLQQVETVNHISTNTINQSRGMY